jgi:hypothetical protein
MRTRLAALALVAATTGCEQYHPTAPTHIRPASDADRAFAAKVGEEKERRRVVNQIEGRAGPIVEPTLKTRDGLVQQRLHLIGPVAVVEGLLDGRAFAGVYWTRDGEIVRRREWFGVAPVDATGFAPTGATRLRAAGDTIQLEIARRLVGGRSAPPPDVRFRDASSGRHDEGSRALTRVVAAGVRVREGWSVGQAAVLLAEDGLWVLVFTDGRVAEVTRYPG